jgi:hypothetical protein
MKTYEQICKIVFALTFGTVALFFADYASLSSIGGMAASGLSLGLALSAVIIASLR